RRQAAPDLGRHRAVRGRQGEQVSDVDTDTAPESSDELAPTAVAVLTHIVKSLVDDPDAVTVEVDDSGRRLTLNVRVGEGELGRVIGRRGRTAASIRTVARAAASKDDVDVDIEFLDD
ncbi:MAG: KH domain-containing protein, partial [Acidobacteriota bacterium]